jgi:hypothetical protein
MMEKKQVQGEFPSLPFAYWLDSFGIRSQLSLRVSIFRSANGPRDINDSGAGHLDGLQLFPTGAGRVAGRRPRGVPWH